MDKSKSFRLSFAIMRYLVVELFVQIAGLLLGSDDF